jgi:hypothetical protein
MVGKGSVSHVSDFSQLAMMTDPWSGQAACRIARSNIAIPASGEPG